ncbi:Ppx/GppA phosphatase family protein [Eleftheria terrae]|uniref:Ppx/GppA phosphatase family protein n=1 Tax=Eleftheria terrae TaxID=1597781 RepID=UPI00263B08ED|nr:Ppx/GppA phosphatase family protein [Eleftheria terrae]WKB52387.1 Ppx/GppA family phosphatase [Eleftheria terrae]
MSLEKTAAPPLPPPSSPDVDGLLAGIDLGSNSFRLEIGQLTHGRYKRIDYLKETVRLGGGLDADGLLTEDATERGLACLARFAERLHGFGPQQVRAVATQTLREARNRDAFLARAQAVLGHPIEVISGREEARLIYAGVARLMPPSAGHRLVIDIGGRSTEMILGRGRTPVVAESFQIGSVGLSMRYFPDGRFTAEGFRAAQVAAGAELEEALEVFAPGLWSEALGSSGTVGAVSQLLLANGITDGAITPESLRWCIEQCLRAGHVDQLQLAGLKDDRRPVLGGGLSILYTLAIHFGIESLQPARGALRQGVIFDLDERRSAGSDHRPVHDVRDESARQLQERFGVDIAQAERVEQVALALYRSVAPRASLDARRQLRWAAALHEVGMMVSHHDHHRHSAYLLAHVDAPGFSQSEQRRLASLVLGQRGGLRKLDEALQDEGFAWQALCLRLALLLCHARRLPTLSALTLERAGRTAYLAWAPDWDSTHPRTAFLLRQEQDAWERSGALKLVLPTR